MKIAILEQILNAPGPDLAAEERLLGEVYKLFDQQVPPSESCDLATRRAENLARIEQKLALQRALGVTLLAGTPVDQIDPVDFVDQFLEKSD